ncbi:MAG: hypothetical protein JWQ60_6010 [Pseudonocardia sp.]|nr:hypothetical protein [Pseudonocardia sp.]
MAQWPRRMQRDGRGGTGAPGRAHRGGRTADRGGPAPPRRVNELHTVQVLGDPNLHRVQLGNDRTLAATWRMPGMLRRAMPLAMTRVTSENRHRR